MNDKVETWRVVLATGEVRGYDAFFAEGLSDDDARCAVVALAANDRLPVAEILAPGEPTRAEMAAEIARIRDDPEKDDTDEAHPAWWRGYNADKGELGHIASTAQSEARTARARVALIEAERDEARAKMHAAEAEVTRLRAENDMPRASTDAAVDGVREMLPAALKVAREEGAAELRALMSGRTTRPTRAEFDALADIGATLRVRWPGGDDESPTHGDYYRTAIATVPEGARWWAHGADGALIEWPKVTP